MWYFVAALTQLPSDTDEENAAPEKKEKKDPDLVSGFAKRKKFKKSEITTEVGPGLTRIFFVENSPKIALSLYCYFGVVYHVYSVCIHC